MRIKTSELEALAEFLSEDIIANTDFIKPEYYKEGYLLSQYFENIIREFISLENEQISEKKQNSQEYWDNLEEERQFENEQFG